MERGGQPVGAVGHILRSVLKDVLIPEGKLEASPSERAQLQARSLQIHEEKAAVVQQLDAAELLLKEDKHSLEQKDEQHYHELRFKRLLQNFEVPVEEGVLREGAFDSRAHAEASMLQATASIGRRAGSSTAAAGGAGLAFSPSSNAGLIATRSMAFPSDIVDDVEHDALVRAGTVKLGSTPPDFVKTAGEPHYLQQTQVSKARRSGTEHRLTETTGAFGALAHREMEAAHAAALQTAGATIRGKQQLVNTTSPSRFSRAEAASLNASSRTGPLFLSSTGKSLAATSKAAGASADAGGVRDLEDAGEDGGLAMLAEGIAASSSSSSSSHPPSILELAYAQDSRVAPSDGWLQGSELAAAGAAARRQGQAGSRKKGNGASGGGGAAASASGKGRGTGFDLDAELAKSIQEVDYEDEEEEEEDEEEEEQQHGSSSPAGRASASSAAAADGSPLTGLAKGSSLYSKAGVAYAGSPSPAADETALRTVVPSSASSSSSHMYAKEERGPDCELVPTGMPGEYMRVRRGGTGLAAASSAGTGKAARNNLLASLASSTGAGGASAGKQSSSGGNAATAGLQELEGVLSGTRGAGLTGALLRSEAVAQARAYMGQKAGGKASGAEERITQKMQRTLSFLRNPRHLSTDKASLLVAGAARIVKQKALGSSTGADGPKGWVPAGTVPPTFSKPILNVDGAEEGAAAPQERKSVRGKVVVATERKAVPQPAGAAAAEAALAATLQQQGAGLTAAAAADVVLQATGGGGMPPAYLRSRGVPQSTLQLKPEGLGTGAAEALAGVFSVKPDRLVFDDYEAGGVYTATVLIRNLDSVSRHLRILPPSSKFFVLENVTMPGAGQQTVRDPQPMLEGASSSTAAAAVATGMAAAAPPSVPFLSATSIIAPGMPVKIQLRFVPHTSAPYNDAVTLVTEAGTFTVPLTARLPAPELTLPLTIDGGFTLAHDKVETILSVKNSGARAHFKLLPQELLDSGGEATADPEGDWSYQEEEGFTQVGPFFISPVSFFLQKEQKMDIRVLFCPKMAGDFSRQMVALCSNGEMVTHTLVANCPELAIGIARIGRLTLPQPDMTVDVDHAAEGADTILARRLEAQKEQQLQSRHAGAGGAAPAAVAAPAGDLMLPELAGLGAGLAAALGVVEPPASAASARGRHGQPSPGSFRVPSLALSAAGSSGPAQEAASSRPRRNDRAGAAGNSSNSGREMLLGSPRAAAGGSNSRQQSPGPRAMPAPPLRGPPPLFVRFDGQVPGCWQSQSITVVNNTPIRVPFRWNIRAWLPVEPPADPDILHSTAALKQQLWQRFMAEQIVSADSHRAFRILPEEGFLPSRGSMAFELRFCPHYLSLYSASAFLEVANIPVDQVTRREAVEARLAALRQKKKRLSKRAGDYTAASTESTQAVSTVIQVKQKEAREHLQGKAIVAEEAPAAAALAEQRQQDVEMTVLTWTQQQQGLEQRQVEQQQLLAATAVSGAAEDGNVNQSGLMDGPATAGGGGRQAEVELVQVLQEPLTYGSCCFLTLAGHGTRPSVSAVPPAVAITTAHGKVLAIEGGETAAAAAAAVAVAAPGSVGSSSSSKSPGRRAGSPSNRASDGGSPLRLDAGAAAAAAEAAATAPQQPCSVASFSLLPGQEGRATVQLVNSSDAPLSFLFPSSRQLKVVDSNLGVRILPAGVAAGQEQEFLAAEGSLHGDASNPSSSAAFLGDWGEGAGAEDRVLLHVEPRIGVLPPRSAVSCTVLFSCNRPGEFAAELGAQLFFGAELGSQFSEADPPLLQGPLDSEQGGRAYGARSLMQLQQQQQQLGLQVQEAMSRLNSLEQLRRCGSCSVQMQARVSYPEVRFTAPCLDFGLQSTCDTVTAVLTLENVSDCPAPVVLSRVCPRPQVLSLRPTKQLLLQDARAVAASSGATALTAAGRELEEQEVEEQRQDPFNYSLLDSEDFSKLAEAEESSLPQLDFLPASAIIPAQSQLQVQVRLRTGSHPVSLQSIVRCLVGAALAADGRSIVTLGPSGHNPVPPALYLRTLAEIQAPLVSLSITKMALGVCFIGVPVRHSFLIRNMCSLPADFSFDGYVGTEPPPPPGSEKELQMQMQQRHQSHGHQEEHHHHHQHGRQGQQQSHQPKVARYEVEISPSQGTLLPKEERLVHVVITPRRTGLVDALIACDVRGMQYPLGFCLTAHIRGITVAFALVDDVTGQVLPLPGKKHALVDDFLAKLKAEEEKRKQAEELRAAGGVTMDLQGEGHALQLYSSSSSSSSSGSPSEAAQQALAHHSRYQSLDPDDQFALSIDSMDARLQQDPAVKAMKRAFAEAMAAGGSVGRVPPISFGDGAPLPLCSRRTMTLHIFNLSGIPSDFLLNAGHYPAWDGRVTAGGEKLRPETEEQQQQQQQQQQGGGMEQLGQTSAAAAAALAGPGINYPAEYAAVEALIEEALESFAAAGATGRVTGGRRQKKEGHFSPNWGFFGTVEARDPEQEAQALMARAASRQSGRSGGAGGGGSRGGGGAAGGHALGSTQEGHAQGGSAAAASQSLRLKNQGSFATGAAGPLALTKRAAGLLKSREHEATHVFASVEGARHIAAAKLKQLMRRSLGFYNGVAFEIFPQRATLPPFGKAVVQLAMLGDLPGSYEDSLVVRMDGWTSILSVPMSATLAGNPLSFVSNAVGFHAKGSKGGLVQGPTLVLGNQLEGGPPVTRTISVQNDSPLDAVLTWRLELDQHAMTMQGEEEDADEEEEEEQQGAEGMMAQEEQKEEAAEGGDAAGAEASATAASSTIPPSFPGMSDSDALLAALKQRNPALRKAKQQRVKPKPVSPALVEEWSHRVPLPFSFSTERLVVPAYGKATMTVTGKPLVLTEDNKEALRALGWPEDMVGCWRGRMVADANFLPPGKALAAEASMFGGASAFGGGGSEGGVGAMFPAPLPFHGGGGGGEDGRGVPAPGHFLGGGESSQGTSTLLLSLPDARFERDALQLRLLLEPFTPCLSLDKRQLSDGLHYVKFSVWSTAIEAQSQPTGMAATALSGTSSAWGSAAVVGAATGGGTQGGKAALQAALASCERTITLTNDQKTDLIFILELNGPFALQQAVTHAPKHPITRLEVLKAAEGAEAAAGAASAAGGKGKKAGSSASVGGSGVAAARQAKAAAAAAAADAASGGAEAGHAGAEPAYGDGTAALPTSFTSEQAPTSLASLFAPGVLDGHAKRIYSLAPQTSMDIRLRFDPAAGQSIKESAAKLFFSSTVSNRADALGAITNTTKLTAAAAAAGQQAGQEGLLGSTFTLGASATAGGAAAAPAAAAGSRDGSGGGSLTSLFRSSARGNGGASAASTATALAGGVPENTLTGKAVSSTMTRLKGDYMGALTITFSNGHKQAVGLRSEVLRPALTAYPPILRFGKIRVGRRKTAALHLGNPTTVDALWSLKHVPAQPNLRSSSALKGMPQSLDFQSLGLAPDHKLWQPAYEPPCPLDDPSVFQFSGSSGVLHGPTLPVEAGPSAVLRAAKGLAQPLQLPVSFCPAVQGAFQCRMRLSCLHGESIEVLLQGEATLDETEEEEH